MQLADEPLPVGAFTRKWVQFTTVEKGQEREQLNEVMCISPTMVANKPGPIELVLVSLDSIAGGQEFVLTTGGRAGTHETTYRARLLAIPAKDQKLYYAVGGTHFGQEKPERALLDEFSAQVLSELPRSKFAVGAEVPTTPRVVEPPPAFAPKEPLSAEESAPDVQSMITSTVAAAMKESMGAFAAQIAALQTGGREAAPARSAPVAPEGEQVDPFFPGVLGVMPPPLRRGVPFGEDSAQRMSDEELEHLANEARAHDLTVLGSTRMPREAHTSASYEGGERRGRTAYPPQRPTPTGLFQPHPASSSVLRPGIQAPALPQPGAGALGVEWPALSAEQVTAALVALLPQARPSGEEATAPGGAGTGGVQQVEVLRREFNRNPLARYTEGMEVAVTDSGAAGTDQLTMLRWFQANVQMTELASRERFHWFTLLQHIHRATEELVGQGNLAHEHAGALLGLVMSGYIFADQATRDFPLLDTAWDVTLLPPVSVAGWCPSHVAAWARRRRITELITLRDALAQAKSTGNWSDYEERATELAKAEHERINAAPTVGGGRNRGKRS